MDSRGFNSTTTKSSYELHQEAEIKNSNFLQGNWKCQHTHSFWTIYHLKKSGFEKNQNKVLKIGFVHILQDLEGEVNFPTIHDIYHKKRWGESAILGHLKPSLNFVVVQNNQN